jgi:hypothetical protein
VNVLQGAAREGDTLLSMNEVGDRVRKLNLAPQLMLTMDWLNAHVDQFAGIVEFEALNPDPTKDETIHALQLSDLREREGYLRRILERRAEKHVPSLGVDWSALLLEAINAKKRVFDPSNPRHARALEEQTSALEAITTRRLGVLVGRAGTGKTSVLGALMRAKALREGGILLLAPTGKARVRLSKATDAEAMTVAQFLFRLGRYDGAHQRPLFEGDTHRKQTTVIIDECSMLTMDDLTAVLKALDLGHVQRLILVGDPNQLPPIGAGRPFSDLAAFLEKRATVKSEELRAVSGSLAKLTVEVRTTQQGPSDTLRLASWYTREAPSVDADKILSDLELGGTFNDMEIMLWKTHDEMKTALLSQFSKHLNIANESDRNGFDAALGIENGDFSISNTEAVERFQVLSPVRMHPHGVHDLNRWIQRTFRKDELEKVRRFSLPGFSDEDITRLDKVIQNSNQLRKGKDPSSKEKGEKYPVANGEIGLVARAGSSKGRDYIGVAFSGRDDLLFYYDTYDFKGGRGPLELAYALTVHKAQGSEFSVVFVVLPRLTKFISRELLYTALTRSRDRLVLLVEGDDPSALYDLTKPERSETGRRNTNLFQIVLRKASDEVPYAENLIHRTLKGHMVRSKSELAIANILHEMQIPYEYERPFEGEAAAGRMRPDFSFITAAGDIVVWEHLGMLDVTAYKEGWEWKKTWYRANGLIENETLFWTNEVGGLDSEVLRTLASRIREIL